MYRVISEVFIIFFGIIGLLNNFAFGMCENTSATYFTQSISDVSISKIFPKLTEDQDTFIQKTVQEKLAALKPHIEKLLTEGDFDQIKEAATWMNESLKLDLATIESGLLKPFASSLDSRIRANTGYLLSFFPVKIEFSTAKKNLSSPNHNEREEALLFFAFNWKDPHFRQRLFSSSRLKVEDFLQDLSLLNEPAAEGPDNRSICKIRRETARRIFLHESPYFSNPLKIKIPINYYFSTVIYSASSPLRLADLDLKPLKNPDPTSIYLFWNEKEKVGIIISLEGEDHMRLSAAIERKGLQKLGGTRASGRKLDGSVNYRNSSFLGNSNGIENQQIYFYLQFEE